MARRGRRMTMASWSRTWPFRSGRPWPRERQTSSPSRSPQDSGSRSRSIPPTGLTPGARQAPHRILAPSRWPATSTPEAAPRTWSDAVSPTSIPSSPAAGERRRCRGSITTTAAHTRRKRQPRAAGPALCPHLTNRPEAALMAARADHRAWSSTRGRSTRNRGSVLFGGRDRRTAAAFRGVLAGPV